MGLFEDLQAMCTVTVKSVLCCHQHGLEGISLNLSWTTGRRPWHALVSLMHLQQTVYSQMWAWSSMQTHFPQIIGCIWWCQAHWWASMKLTQLWSCKAMPYVTCYHVEVPWKYGRLKYPLQNMALVVGLNHLGARLLSAASQSLRCLFVAVVPTMSSFPHQLAAYFLARLIWAHFGTATSTKTVSSHQSANLS